MGREAAFDRGRKHVASDGTQVRSKSEMIIANLLHAKNVAYDYEAPLTRDGQTKRPDFTIKTANRTYYWEHLGMLTDAAYAKSWSKKEEWYRRHGISKTSEYERLILTRDGPDGSFDSSQASQAIAMILAPGPGNAAE